ncbi:MAG: hypothetical protein PHW74_06340 [Desulfobacca sp.]|nr:hypothetical protein [Desulfobacca sp.]
MTEAELAQFLGKYCYLEWEQDGRVSGISGWVRKIATGWVLVDYGPKVRIAAIVRVKVLRAP